jgi:hypothetical protein
MSHYQKKINQLYDKPTVFKQIVDIHRFTYQPRSPYEHPLSYGGGLDGPTDINTHAQEVTDTPSVTYSKHLPGFYHLNK